MTDLQNALVNVGSALVGVFTGWFLELYRHSFSLRSRARSHARLWVAELADLRAAIDERAHWHTPFPFVRPSAQELREIFELYESALATKLHSFFAEVSRLSVTGELARHALVEGLQDTKEPKYAITSEQTLSERKLLADVHRKRIDRLIEDFDRQKERTLSAATDAIEQLERRQ